MTLDARFVIISIFVYIGVLFLAAQWWEAQIQKKKHTWLEPFIYALSFACYQSAWSLLASSGDVTRDGYKFMAIEIGPVISAFLWWIILRKIVVLKNIFRITIPTRPDFGPHFDFLCTRRRLIHKFAVGIDVSRALFTEK